MKSFYKFLFYKLYRFAISNEKSSPVDWSFVSLAAIFEGFHLALLGVPLKYYKFDLNVDIRITSILFVIIGFLLNYLFFIKNKKIQKIHIYYQEKNYSVWKGNLLFFGYVLLLFLIMFSQIYILKSIEK